MSITIELDPQRQWLVATATGEITIDAVAELLRTARAPIDQRMKPMLFDARGATTSMTEADVDTATGIVRAAIAAGGPRGHVALVADDDRFYDWLMMYEVRCAAIGVRSIRVFRLRPDAERWLAVMSATRNLH